MTSLALFCALAVAKTPPPRAIAYTSLARDGGIYHVAIANTPSGGVKATTIHSKRLVSAWSLIAREYPTVAITGTFFNPRGGRPVADVVVDGERVASGERGTAVAIDWWGNVRIFDTRFGQRVDWSQYRWALRGGVRVVQRGVVRPNPQAQRFRDKRIWGHAPRTGVGLRSDGKVVLIATERSVTLSQLGRAMKAVGVVEGVSLDGGNSTMFYYRGRMLISPNRKLSNVLAFSERPPF